VTCEQVADLQDSVRRMYVRTGPDEWQSLLPRGLEDLLVQFITMVPGPEKDAAAVSIRVFVTAHPGAVPGDIETYLERWQG